MTEQGYTGANWIIGKGDEETFTGRWNEFFSWTRDNAPGFVTANLIRHIDHPQHFVGFSVWTDEASIRAWMKMPEFTRLFDACRAVCEDFDGGGFRRVVAISHRPQAEGAPMM